MISLDPIAYVETLSNEKADVPRQGSLAQENLGRIRFLPGKLFEQGLEDLEGMEKIWVLFWMDRVGHWKPKVQPPRDVTKKGVFATRSPHRPNPIGLSCVTLVGVKGLDLFIKDHDFLDKTPVLDIKPYLPYADSFPNAKTGWIETAPPLSLYNVTWRDVSLQQLAYLKNEGVDLRAKIEARLKHFDAPSPSNRIRSLGEDFYIEAYKEWRILFQKQGASLVVLVLVSGYEPPLEGLHKCFSEEFGSFFSERFVGKGWMLYDHSLKQRKERGIHGKDF